MSGLLDPPSSIRDLRTTAHLALSNRLTKIDLSTILVYILADVPDSALPALAWQFDITSPLWALITSAADQRSLIIDSIALHRTLGTPYAIKTALATQGWQSVLLLEGQNSWGGVVWPPSVAWAVFRVIIDKAAVSFGASAASWDAVTDIDTLGDVDTLQSATFASSTINTLQQQQALEAVLFFKPARSYLDSIYFREVPISEQIIPLTDNGISLSLGPIQSEPKIGLTDYPTVPVWNLSDRFSPLFYYDGTYYYSGGVDFTGNVQPSLVTGPIIINGTVVNAT